MEYLRNKLMEPIWGERMTEAHVSSVPDDHRHTVALGFVAVRDRVVLKEFSTRLETAPESDLWGDEMWVNDLHLESQYPESDPAWRRDVLTRGLAIVEALLPLMRTASGGRTVQALVSLQSAESTVDPVMDFACGNVRFVTLRASEDDLRTDMDGSDQPAVVVTLG